MFRTTIMAAVSALALSAGAHADDMFRSVQPVAAADDGLPGSIEFGQLNSAVMDMHAGERIDLNFGAGYEAELDRVTVGDLGARTWVGRIAGEDIRNRVIITETNGFVFGQINTPDGTWHIVPNRTGGHRIFQHHPDATVPEWGDDGIPTGYIPEDVIEDSPFVAEDPATGEAVAVGSNGTVDIAVYYTQSMVDLWGLAVGARVQFLVALLDQAHIDSDTGMRARLVDLAPTPVVVSETLRNSNCTTNCGTAGPGDGILDDLQDGAGDGVAGNNVDLSSLLAIRDAKGADLVSILRHYDAARHGSCGVAYVLGGSTDSISTGDAPFGVSINSDWIDRNWSGTGGYSFCTDQTFAHEVGHNTGFAHNIPDSSAGSGVRPYAHGHRVSSGEMFRTIMSYATGGGISEPRVNFFSNPDINLCPSGAACGVANASDNARAAREEGRDITEFREIAPRVVSAVLPVTRSVVNGTAATAFATVINPAANASTATGCGLRLAGASASQFSYQTTTSANALTGTANTPVDIPSGGSQNFVFSVTSAATWADNGRSPRASDFDETDLFIEAFCANRRSAEYTLGLNSLTFSSSATAPADVIALAATAGNTGRVEVPTTGNQVGVFSVAVTNVGEAAVINVSADTGGRALNIQNIEVCQTNPTTGACTTTRAPTTSLTINNNATATFGIFVRGNGSAIDNDPARNRVFVRFTDVGGERGATSVAVRTQ
ncbi:M12 family metallo-peptidase [Hyphobacterium sp. SN044]|uniref:reprolysin-like metallopeptidase n=1 Tax=Hyphobacterium sp. SN044 TaxID=2912575 RepID=UPI001F19422A|nr:M12 family metallo-peptidase [Hyphobacterium sp. SN044]MCF8879534.1 M12 family metallo-peptidase [Hyphobacterium sp. SN044]